MAAKLHLDLLDPELYRTDPHDLWTQLRHEEPVYRDEQNSLWALTRHKDVLEAERASDVFSSRGAYRANVGIEEANMIAHDDPRHAAQRRLVLGRFTPAAMRRKEAEMQALIDELVDAVADHGRMEVVEDLAAQLPSRLTARMIGFPEDEWPMVRGWSERLMRIDDRRTSSSIEGLMTASIELYQRVTAEVPERRGCPMDDLLTVWSTAKIDGEELPIETIFHEAGLFVSGGAETTRTLISHGLRTFVDHPDQWELLASDPSLVPSAVEEMLRWVTPLNNMFRTVARDTEIGGRALAAGDRVMLLYPSANRDEEVFADPFTFDVRRSPNPHLAFGNGTHFCLGATLARQLLKLLFTTLTQRFTSLAVVSEPDVEPNLFARAVRSFELSFTPR
ncbi:MAG TPA: cytochrome P450 [Acidimicrobiales bacterium]|nr:cytochrome P450 [Acidimicrobiales bacterium]